MALQVALTGALATRIDKLISIVDSGHFGAEAIALIVVTAGYALSVAGAIGMAAAVYMPRSPKTNRSLIFFEDIAEMDYSTFEAAAKDMTSDSIEQYLIDQTYQVSRVASLKMRRARLALWLSLPTVVLGITLLAWGST